MSALSTTGKRKNNSIGIVHTNRSYVASACSKHGNQSVHQITLLGRCLQHRGGEPERAKGADGMQLFVLDCIAYIVDVETN